MNHATAHEFLYPVDLPPRLGARPNLHVDKHVEWQHTSFSRRTSSNGCPKHPIGSSIPKCVAVLYNRYPHRCKYCDGSAGYKATSLIIRLCSTKRSHACDSSQLRVWKEIPHHAPRSRHSDLASLNERGTRTCFLCHSMDM
jgi:hypothetical protein